MQDLKFFLPHSIKNKKNKNSDQCWYLVVFGSRSVLLGVLLIKSLPSKRISHIRLDRNKNLKKKKTRSVRVEEDEERKKKKRKKIKRMTEQRDLPRRWQSREKRWEA